MPADEIQEYPDIVDMGGITFNLPVFAGPLDHGELKPVIHGPVDKMIDEIDFRGLVNRFPYLMDAVKNRFRVFPLVFLEQGKGLVDDIEVFFKILIPDEMGQGGIDVAQCLDMNGG